MKRLIWSWIDAIVRLIIGSRAMTMISPVIQDDLQGQLFSSIQSRLQCHSLFFVAPFPFYSTFYSDH